MNPRRRGDGGPEGYALSPDPYLLGSFPPRLRKLSWLAREPKRIASEHGPGRERTPPGPPVYVRRERRATTRARAGGSREPTRGGAAPPEPIRHAEPSRWRPWRSREPRGAAAAHETRRRVPVRPPAARPALAAWPTWAGGPPSGCRAPCRAA